MRSRPNTHDLQLDHASFSLFGEKQHQKELFSVLFLLVSVFVLVFIFMCKPSAFDLSKPSGFHFSKPRGYRISKPDGFLLTGDLARRGYGASHFSGQPPDLLYKFGHLHRA